MDEPSGIEQDVVIHSITTLEMYLGLIPLF